MTLFPYTTLFRSYYLLRTRLQQVGVPPEAVMAVGGLVIRPLARHQQAVPTKQGKQAVTSQGWPGLIGSGVHQLQ
jgi:hypothetical protein